MIPSLAILRVRSRRGRFAADRVGQAFSLPTRFSGSSRLKGGRAE